MVKQTKIVSESLLRPSARVIFLAGCLLFPGRHGSFPHFPVVWLASWTMHDRARHVQHPLQAAGCQNATLCDAERQSFRYALTSRSSFAHLRAKVGACCASPSHPKDHYDKCK